MFWCFGVSREIRFELACRKYNKKAKILTFDPTPLSQQTVDSANRGNYKIEHTPKAYDTESGKTLNFYAIDESLKCYQLDKPKGVRGRSSDNSKIYNNFGWSPSIKLYDGLKTTYSWIYNQITSGENTKKFTKSY